MPAYIKSKFLRQSVLAFSGMPLFISTAAWHVIELGRHSSLAMSSLISTLAAGGVLLVLKTYTLKISKNNSEV